MSSELIIFIGSGIGILAILAHLGTFIIVVISYSRVRSQGLLFIGISQILAFMFKSIIFLFNTFIFPIVAAEVNSVTEVMVSTSVIGIISSVGNIIILIILGIGVLMIGNELAGKTYSQKY